MRNIQDVVEAFLVIGAVISLLSMGIFIGRNFGTMANFVSYLIVLHLEDK